MKGAKRMLNHFSEFRSLLDRILIQSFGKQIVLYGYGRSGRFIQWYAQYYHNLQVDYIITEDWSSAIPYEFPLFRNTLLEYDYKGASNAIVWLAVPDYKNAVSFLEAHGYVKNVSYFNLCESVYGDGLFVQKDDKENVFTRKKTGYRDIQFMEWLEYKYDCNFVTRIDQKDFTGEKIGHAPYILTADKIILPLLDQCHIDWKDENAIFDFGCGKGGALVTFLDYGFGKAGGVEYEKNIYNVLENNMSKLGLQDQLELIEGDAAAVTDELDKYNWFYFFNPFAQEIFEKVICNITDSVARNARKIYLIVINPHAYRLIKDNGFYLINQFEVATRQRVVDVFTNQI